MPKNQLQLQANRQTGQHIRSRQRISTKAKVDALSNTSTQETLRDAKQTQFLKQQLLFKPHQAHPTPQIFLHCYCSPMRHPPRLHDATDITTPMPQVLSPHHPSGTAHRTAPSQLISPPRASPTRSPAPHSERRRSPCCSAPPLRPLASGFPPRRASSSNVPPRRRAVQRRDPLPRVIACPVAAPLAALPPRCGVQGGHPVTRALDAVLELKLLAQRRAHVGGRGQSRQQRHELEQLAVRRVVEPALDGHPVVHLEREPSQMLRGTRHRMPCDVRNEGYKCVSMTWQAMDLADTARLLYVIVSDRMPCDSRYGGSNMCRWRGGQCLPGVTWNPKAWGELSMMMVRARQEGHSEPALEPVSDHDFRVDAHTDARTRFMVECSF